MEIKHHDNGSRGMFYAEMENKNVGELTYSWAGKDRIAIDHTHVNPALEGKGIAKQLLNEAVNFAREKGLKIIPLCSYVRHAFDTDTVYQDVQE